MFSNYTSGELQLIYTLIDEFPGQISLEMAPGESSKFTLKITSVAMVSFVEFLLRRMRSSRQYVSTVSGQSE